MRLPLIKSGYDVSILVRVRRDSANESLTGCTIKASLVNADKSAELITDTAQSSSATGADWANGLVAIEFSAANTTALTPLPTAYIELSIVDTNAKRLPCEDIPVTIEKGWTIS